MQLSAFFKNKATLDGDHKLNIKKQCSDAKHDYNMSPIVVKSRFQRSFQTICKSSSRKNGTKNQSFESLKFMSNKVIFDRMHPKSNVHESSIQVTQCSDVNTNIQTSKQLQDSLPLDKYVDTTVTRRYDLVDQSVLSKDIDGPKMTKSRNMMKSRN